MNTLVFEGVAFNADLAAKISEAQFLKEHGHHDLSDEQLKQVHALAMNTVKSAPKEAPVKPDIKLIKEDGKMADEKELAALGAKPVVKPADQK
jgi:hypothetical protein